ncbi:IS66 family insertion sequence element accessory protein TnpA [Thiomicrorhabdus indica]|uniref:IS66 family insertion sequence element accessory protein TnpA n=1 Tax=Thiomicrorhabdus indica TaxID=2267253 RepID=UPI0039844111
MKFVILLCVLNYRRITRRHALWAKRMFDWQTRGVSQRVFCNHQGFEMSTFQYLVTKTAPT